MSLNISVQQFSSSEINSLMSNTAKYFRQRKLNANDIQRYKNDMVGNGWLDTSQTIGLGTSNGKEVIVDGQHRLAAALESKVMPKFIVVRNVPLESFKVYDQGRQRTLSDAFHINGNGWEDGANYLSNTVKMLYKQHCTGFPNQSITHKHHIGTGTLFDWAAKHYPDLPDVYGSHAKAFLKIQRAALGPVSLMLYLKVVWDPQDKELCKQILNYLFLKADYKLLSSRLNQRAMRGKVCVATRKQLESVTQKLNDQPPLGTVWDTAIEYIAKWRENNTNAEGKLPPGANKNLSDVTLFAYLTAWNLCRSGKSNYKNVLRKALNKNYNAWRGPKVL